MRRRNKQQSATTTTVVAPPMVVEADNDNGKSAFSKKSSKNDILPPATHLYLLTWCLHFLVVFFDTHILKDGFGALDLRNNTKQDIEILLPLILVLLFLLCVPTGTSSMKYLAVPVAVVAHALDMGIRWSRMPLVWDHECWATVMNAAFVLCYLTGASAKTETLFLQLTQVQMGMLYVAAAFWKLTTSFMDYKTSCGTVLIMEFFGAYTGNLEIPQWLLEIVAYTAPHMTLLAEAGIGVGMSYVGLLWNARYDRGAVRFWRDATVIFATVFHIILIMGPVNSAGGFSNECITRFLLFFDSKEVDAFYNHVKRNRVATCAMGAGFTLGLIILRHLFVGAIFDLWFFGSGLWSTMYFIMIYCAAGVKKLDDSPKDTATTKTSTLSTICIATGALGVCIIYSFVLPVLGLQQMGGPTMYANLRYFDGGNHLLLPVGTLGEDILFGGGTANVLSSNCSALNRQLGFIPSKDVFPSRIVDMLTSTMRQEISDDNPSENYHNLPFQVFPMCKRNPHARNVLTEVYAAANPPGSSMYAPARLPISLVKKALKEASESNTTTHDYLVKLANPKDPERIVVLNGNNGGSCEIVNLEGEVLEHGDACAADDFAKMFLQEDEPTTGFLSYLVSKFLNPYPALLGLKEEICMS
jgi:hypothetical protein